MNKLALGLAFFFVAASMAGAATWFVDAGNTSGAADGASWETAMTSIQAAMDAAASGDRVIVARGEYRENIRFDGKNLVVQSASPSESAVVANTIIDGGAEGPVVTFRGTETRQCVLIGFTLTNGRAPNGGGILGNRTNATIARNVITGNTATGAVGAAAGSGGGVYNCLGMIQNNLIANNTAEGNGGGVALCPGTIEGNIIRANTAMYGGGVYNSDGLIQKNQISGNVVTELGGGLYGCRGVIQNNVIYENEAKFGAGLSTCDANIRNNTISNNKATNGGGGLAYCSQRTTIVNCIVWGNAPELSAQLLQSADTMYSCVQWLKTLDNGNINERPRFVDWRNGNFHLRDSSPCIDAGKGIVGLTEDIDGDERGYAGSETPVGDASHFDIGADEFTGVKALMFTRMVPGWQYQPGEFVDVTVELNDFERSGESSNLVLTETLPEGWSFAGLVSEVRPDVAEVAGGQVRFAWSNASNMPALPYAFTYRLNTAATAGGPQNLSGQAQYEVGGETIATKVVVNRLLGPGGGALDEAYVDQIELQGETLGWSFEVGLTEEVSSVPVLELTGFDEGSVPKARPGAKKLVLSGKSLPAIFDWRDKNGLTPIKYQGACGSCWAFATNGVVESLVKIRDGQDIDLSEQYLVSANNSPHSNGGYWGCEGGSIAFDYYIDRQSQCGTVGPVLEATFPYTGVDTAPNCPYATTSLRLDTWNFVEGRDPSIAAMKQAVMEYGPIFTSVYADAAFQSYKGGVYNNDPATDLTNHAVIIVGWDDHEGASGAWIMRNSWSTQWGDAGYMLISYDVANIGRWSAFGDYAAAEETGSLFVTIEPQTARSQGAQWRVDGGVWQNSGDTVVGLSAGPHTVSFKEVNGYQTPANQSVTISDGQTQSASATYAAAVGETGSLAITIEPEGARTAGAKWGVDGGAATHNSGETVADLNTGLHTVSFSTVSGWSKPIDVSLSVTLNSTTEYTGTYEQNGAVRVTIEPQAARDAGAQWQLDGGSARASGQTVSGVTTGAHAVSFQAINGWAAPTSQSVDVSAGSMATATGAYVQQTDGTLQVNIDPAGARSAGAQWRVDGGAWQDSGVSASLAAGTHAVSFKTVSGWSAPSNRNVWIDSSVASISTANYTQAATGATVTVTISPAAAVTAGAQWRIDGGAWQASGASITGVSTGSHTVSFSTVNGWQTPGNWSFTITGTETRTYNATYTALAEGEGEGDGEGTQEGQPDGEGEGQADLDSDNDGLTDAEETAIYGTNPNDDDSDDDGWLDGQEVDCASDPLNPDSTCDESACGCAKRAMNGDFRDYLGDLFLLGLGLGALIAASALRRR